MRLAFAPYMLDLRRPAGTSRGVLTQKPTVFIKVWDENNPGLYGIGEAAVFPNLSPEANESLPYKFMELLANVALGRRTDLSRHSSVQFGFEQALYDFSNGGKGLYFPSAFTEGKQEIEINGLIWMGTEQEMLERIEEKMEQGFRCIKLKVGGIDWAGELRLLRHIRALPGGGDVVLRVDANGSFSMDNALPRLKALADLGVHSIEQPIAARNVELMAFLCQVSPLPIALDEELIGVPDSDARAAILDAIRPAYIILKPALCGGFSGAEDWIRLAKERGIGYWATSALESNVGLTAIAQWAATIGCDMPQGLGTGALFTNNFPSRLRLEGDMMSYSPELPIDRSVFDNLPWQE